MKLYHKLNLVIILLGLNFSASAQNTLSIEVCRAKALENNHRILESSANIRVAQKNYEGAAAAIYPEVYGAGSAYYFANRPSDLFPDFTSSVSLNAQYTLYGGGRIKNSIESAQLQVGTSQTKKELQEADIVLAVDRNYWDLVRLREQVVLAQNNQAFLEELIQDLQNYYDAGLIQKNDLLEVQVNLNQAKLQLLQAQQGESLSRSASGAKNGLGYEC